MPSRAVWGETSLISFGSKKVSTFSKLKFLLDHGSLVKWICLDIVFGIHLIKFNLIHDFTQLFISQVGKCRRKGLFDGFCILSSYILNFISYFIVSLQIAAHLIPIYCRYVTFAHFDNVFNSN